MPHLTQTALIAAGQAAAKAGVPIYEASIAANLDSASLLVFEGAYFAERFAAEQVRGQGISGVDEGCFVHGVDLLFISRAKVRNCSQQG